MAVPRLVLVEAVKAKAAKPGVAKSSVAKSLVAKSLISKSSAVKSRGAKPGAAKRDGTRTKIEAAGPKAARLVAAGPKVPRSKGVTPRPLATRGGASPRDHARLAARIRALTAELAEARERIAELEAFADTDGLLDVFNRRGFERELTRAIAYIKRYRASGVLVVLDVDRLKPINDTFGHAAGDAVLKAVVNAVLRHVRASDVVGRLGGDEFAVLLWNLTEADALAKAAALEDAVDALSFVFRGQPMTAGASSGIAVLTAADDAQGALERADLAMYARKAARRLARS
ncbi:diguanylate cyclase domain-containing protein [Bradyrhizobium sp. U87765 SZCCT0109]|uniref:GGDEF domain-containing protein n=1 Tax=Bradyrhizobium sp. U87765 SZCCT0109 TaxID=2807656 RepID=UPI00352F747D